MSFRLISLLFVSTFLIGCGQSDPFPLPAETPTEPVVTKADGHEYEFPATVDFDGETWIRVKQDPAEDVPGVTFVYASDKRDDYLFYSCFQPKKLQAHGYPMEKQLALAKVNPESSSMILEGPTEIHLGGGLLLKSQFANHRKTGVEELFDPEGNLKFRGHSNQGRMQGDCTYFYEDGKPMLQGKFSGGELLEGTGFDEEGNETPLANQTDMMLFLAKRLNQ